MSGTDGLTGTGWAAAAWLAAIAAVLTAVGSGWVLRNVPEPSADMLGAEEKRVYLDLVRPTFVLGVTGVSVAIAGVTGWLLPPALWPPWLVLATFGALLAGIDAATTWLPNTLMYPAWAAMVVAAGVSVALGGGPTVLLRMAVGSATWGVLFWLTWWVSRRQIGFGDVRLGFLLGAAAGATGWQTAYACLLLGTVVGAGWGLVGRIRNRHNARQPFAYGPSLLIGCGLGLLTLLWSR